jgi:hypothetical protein
LVEVGTVVGVVEEAEEGAAGVVVVVDEEGNA